MPHITLIVPVFNESRNIRPMVQSISNIFSTLSHTYTLLFIDDGSIDTTWQTIATQRTQDNTIHGIRLTRNFGHQAALLAGIHHATGDAIITMDGDLQHPPTVLPQLIHAWEAGSKLVCTIRQEKTTQPFFKSVLSQLYYRTQEYFISPRHNLGTSDFRLIDQSIQRYLITFPHGNLNLRSALQYSGYPAHLITYRVGERYSGKSKFTLRKMLQLATAGIVPFSTKPLLLSMLLSLLSLLVILFVTFISSVTGTNRRLHNEAYKRASAHLYLLNPLVILQTTIAWYLSDVHLSVHKYPKYIIRDSLGFSAPISAMYL